MAYNMHGKDFVAYVSMSDLKEMYADNQTKTWDDTKYLKKLQVEHENLVGFGEQVFFFSSKISRVS